MMQSPVSSSICLPIGPAYRLYAAACGMAGAHLAHTRVARFPARGTWIQLQTKIKIKL